MVGADGIGVPRRLAGLERTELAWLPDVRVCIARTPQARLLGLAWMADLPADCALLIPRCRSVHTFGMRFALEVVFLDERWRPLGSGRPAPPRRVVVERAAAAALERRVR
jgi:hypothetical protein